MSKKQKRSSRRTARRNRPLLSRLFGWIVMAVGTIWSFLNDAKDVWELLEWLQQVASYLR